MYKYSVYVPGAAVHLWDGDDYANATNMFARWHSTIPGIKLVLVDNSTGEVVLDVNMGKEK